MKWAKHRSGRGWGESVKTNLVSKCQLILIPAAHGQGYIWPQYARSYKFSGETKNS